MGTFALMSCLFEGILNKFSRYLHFPILKTLAPLFCILLTTLSMSLSCVKTPIIVKPQDPNLDIKKPGFKAQPPKALWFTSSNFSTGGYLGRLDLEKGTIQRKVMKVGHDALVIPDSMDSIFLINRSGQDAIAKIKGSQGLIELSLPLPAKSNPQFAISDSFGNLWISFLELNSVHVYSSDFKTLLREIDLSSLGIRYDDGSIHADLGPMVIYKNNTVIVAAQRLHRERSWVPDSHSGLAYINVANLELISTDFVPVSNPVLVGVDSSQDSILLVGRGDLSNFSGGAMGQFSFLNFMRKTLMHSTTISGKIIAADFYEGDLEPTIIVWYPSLSKSCIQKGGAIILCQSGTANNGYLFTSIKTMGDMIFVSFYDNKSSELWLISDLLNPQPRVQKIEMDLPIFSLSFGP